MIKSGNILIREVSRFKNFATDIAHKSDSDLVSSDKLVMLPARTPHGIVTRYANALNNFQEFLGSRLKICHDGYKLQKFNRLSEFIPLSIFGKLSIC